MIFEVYIKAPYFGKLPQETLVSDPGNSKWQAASGTFPNLRFS